MPKGWFVCIYLLFVLHNGLAQSLPKDPAKRLDTLPNVMNDSVYGFLNIPSIETPAIDSALAVSQGSQLIRKVEQQLLETEELKAFNELKSNSPFQSTPMITGLPSGEYKKENLTSMALEEGRKFMQAYQQELAEATTSLQGLKQKYSSLPSSSDPEMGIKRNSLKEASFGKRLVWGGNLAFTQLDPVGINAAPVVGWRFSQRLEAGLSALYVTGSVEQASMGMSGFASYTIWKNFFGYAEHERVRVGNGEQANRTWQTSNLVGLGSRLRVSSWMEVLFIACYNFSHENANYIYSNPLVVKTGFRFY